jgi:putative flippase GtrA
MKKLISQFFKFGVVGVIAFIVDYLSLYLLTEFLNVYYLISSIISFLLSIIVNYILSIKWVFDIKKKQSFKDVIIFTLLSAIGLLINLLVMYLSVEVFKIHYMIGKLIATFIVMIWNFVIRKMFLE